MLGLLGRTPDDPERPPQRASADPRGADERKSDGRRRRARRRDTLFRAAGL